MSRLFRWQYSVPRVMAIVVALLAVQFFLGLAARSRIDRSMQSLFGADTQLSSARVSFLDGRVILHDLRMADPTSGRRDLFDFERSDLVFDLDALIRHGVWSGKGHISGLHFFGPEGTRISPEASPKNVADGHFGGPESQAVRACLERSVQILNQDWTDQLPSLNLTNQVADAWSLKRQELSRQLNELAKKSDDLQMLADAEQRNPLRNSAFLETLPSDIESLQAKAAAVQLEIDHAPDALDKARRIIVASRPQDEQFLREKLVSPELNATQLATYLYAKHVNELLPQITAWLKWSRQAFPAETNTSVQNRAPQVLLQSISVDGEVHIAGRPFNVAGEMKDFTPRPSLLRGPMRLRLTSFENSDLDIQLTVDRSAATPVDELLVTCRSDSIPETALGSATGLQLQLAPAVTSFTISLRLEGNQIAGEMQIVQTGAHLSSKLTLTPETSPLANALNETLSGIDSVATRLSLSGTLDEPRCVLWSNLGPATSSALQIAAKRAAEQRKQTLLASSQIRIDERLANLDRRIAENQSELLAQLAASRETWQTLAAEVDSPSRLQIERLGRLPAHSLFR
jgi:uncharacterized protein (TIGR03545 family)